MTQVPMGFTNAGGTDSSVQDTSSLFSAVGLTGATGTALTNSQVNPDLLSFLIAEMQAGGGVASGNLEGFRVENVQDTASFMHYVSLAETFWANTGYQWMPPARYLAALTDPRWMTPGGQTDDKVIAWFQALMPTSLQQALPGLKYGMSQADYVKTVTQYTSAMQSLTGVAYVDPTMLDNAIKTGQTPGDMIKALEMDPTFLAQYPWLDPKSGYAAAGVHDYASYQAYQFNENQTVTDYWNTLTGNATVPQNIMQQAMAGHWDQRQILEAIQGDPSLLNQYAYLDQQYNIQSYSQWQSIKQQQHQDVINRFGQQGLTDANILSNYMTPVQGIHAQATSSNLAPKYTANTSGSSVR